MRPNKGEAISIKETEIVVVGGGPAGLSAAIEAATLGAEVTVLDNGLRLGGQLIKQTHKFFGSVKQYAGWRGFEIAEHLLDRLARCKGAALIPNATVTGYYEDGTLTAVNEGRLEVFKPGRLIVATGASENMLPFLNNDLPGVYGAGAVQTLMNLHGVLPGRKVLMVGAGNIGLIVTYQLLQAGATVCAIVESLPSISGYFVHASKVRRLGVPVLTFHSIKAAHGHGAVERAVLVRLNGKGDEVAGTEREVEVDVVCLAVGLSPLCDLLWQADCEMRYVPELGGHVPLRDGKMRTTRHAVFVAGDAGGVGEATSAMIEGRLAGIEAALSLGHGKKGALDVASALERDLAVLRANPSSARVRSGLKKASLPKEREPCR